MSPPIKMNPIQKVDEMIKLYYLTFLNSLTKFSLLIFI